jgi:cytochrome c oxidase subunit 2
MAIYPPTNKNWWNEPLEKTELTWIIVAFLWGMVMFFSMIIWHVIGNQNLSNEAYKVKPEVYAERTEAAAEKYKVGEEGDSGIPVVHPPAGGDAYMLARLWEWWPVLELEKGKTYRLHLSSLDWLHGFSMQPTNINIEVHPNYEMILTITPDKAGVYDIVCNEFCGIGHHTMVGRIRIVE